MKTNSRPSENCVIPEKKRKRVNIIFLKHVHTYVWDKCGAVACGRDRVRVQWVAVDASSSNREVPWRFKRDRARSDR
ncbi:hypothetical protein EVAR_14061_1 [Eumeta japonica]|uniref:Uncharacterized protein n=1 Tax=Eumeta variegata TaxID=151549 RepID=A0A4C1UPH0_EUMVA|nr:hypothetical protein EVAR_14061_1 [Eumeta japonica]